MNERELRTIIRHVTDELRALRQEIRAIHQKPQAATEEPTEEPVRPIPLEVQTDSITQHAIREYYETQNREQKSWFGRHKRWIETGGVGIAFTLAMFTLLTMCEIRKQTPAIKTSAEAAERASNLAVIQAKAVLAAEGVFRLNADCQGGIGILSFFAFNKGRVVARDAAIKGNIAIKAWPTKAPLRPSIPFAIEFEPLLPPSEGGLSEQRITKEYVVPQKDLCAQMATGRQFVEIEWSAIYDSGFYDNAVKEIINRPSLCQSWAYLSSNGTLSGAGKGRNLGLYPCGEAFDNAMQNAISQTQE